MDDLWGLGSQFTSPSWYNFSGSSYPHSHQDPFQRPSAGYRDFEEFYNPAGFVRPASAYQAHHPPPRRHQHSLDSFSQPLSPSHAPRRPQYSHLPDSDPGYIDLRFLPGFQYHSLAPQSGYLAQHQEPAGIYGRSEPGSPKRPQLRTRQIAIDDDNPAETGIPGLPFSFARTNPGARSSRPASRRSQAASESDDADEADDLESEQQRLLFLRQQQQLKERRLRQQKEQQEQERRAAKEAQEHRFRERVEQLIAQDERRADEERERRRAQQLHEHYKAQRRQRAQQQLQYQRLQEQELWHQQQDHYEAERRQRAQLQRQQQQLRQQQLEEREAETHRREQEEQERYIAQQQQLLREQQQRRRRGRQAEAESQLRQPSATQAESSGTAKAQQAKREADDPSVEQLRDMINEATRQHQPQQRQQAGGLTADQLQQQQRSVDEQARHQQQHRQQQQQRQNQAGGLFAERFQHQQGPGQQQQKRQTGGLTAEQLQQQKFDELYQQWSQLQTEQAKHHTAAKAHQPRSSQQQEEDSRIAGQLPRDSQQQQEEDSGIANQQPRQSQQEEDSRIVEQLESKASLKPDATAVIIQKLLRGQRLRSERPLLEKLLQANSKLNNVASRLEEVIDCIDALRDSESSQPVAKLKQSQGQVASPEQLQKQLVELSELSMQVVLSMDDLHSDTREVRSLRKRTVKRSLALMEQIDNVRAGMLRSVMDTHPHDDQSEFSNFESDSDAVSTDQQHPGDIKTRDEEEEQKQQTGDEPTVPNQLTAEEKRDELVTHALNQLNLGEEEGLKPDQEEQQKDTANAANGTSAADSIQNGNAFSAEQDAEPSAASTKAGKAGNE